MKLPSDQSELSVVFTSWWLSVVLDKGLSQSYQEIPGMEPGTFFSKEVCIISRPSILHHHVSSDYLLCPQDEFFWLGYRQSKELHDTSDFSFQHSLAKLYSTLLVFMNWLAFSPMHQRHREKFRGWIYLRVPLVLH